MCVYIYKCIIASALLSIHYREDETEYRQVSMTSCDGTVMKILLNSQYPEPFLIPYSQGQ